jgi:hypothetical protein
MDMQCTDYAPLRCANSYASRNNSIFTIIPPIGGVVRARAPAQGCKAEAGEAEEDLKR